MGERRDSAGSRGSASGSGDDVVRITTAAPSRAEEIAGRQRRYLISMAIRTACVIGAVWVGPGVLRWFLFAGAVFLPYVAVVMANATDRRPREGTLPPVTPDHRQIGN
ncbi:DUF3099 domain-containing protein [Nocardioides limicola]|uniref:DUF3099 domain-containing protein n=1 Tax=Nocardioides limicola TaxID=2803368 RepID=UPI00193C4BBA|nr:DUF3099 domain-containing protein [Nocardioides sp. DJM-14]